MLMKIILFFLLICFEDVNLILDKFFVTLNWFVLLSFNYESWSIGDNFVVDKDFMNCEFGENWGDFGFSSYWYWKDFDRPLDLNLSDFDTLLNWN
jgi:nitric oxide synthase oxygenase domain/subunit